MKNIINVNTFIILLLLLLLFSSFGLSKCESVGANKVLEVVGGWGGPSTSLFASPITKQKLSLDADI